MTNLMLYAGADEVSEVEVFESPTPEGTDTWTPIPHSKLITLVSRAIEATGFVIERREYGLFHGGARMFGVWALTNGQSQPDYQMTVGIRNSHDKSFSAGLALGSRVFVCDNLCFSGEITIARKHTRWIMNDLERLVLEAVGRLSEARGIQDQRIAAYKVTDLTDAQVHDILLRSVDAKVMANAMVPKVLAEWREPRHEDFKPRNAWSLMNSFTEVFKGTNPLDLTGRTTRLHGLLDLQTGALGKQADAITETSRLLGNPVVGEVILN